MAEAPEAVGDTGTTAEPVVEPIPDPPVWHASLRRLQDASLSDKDRLSASSELLTFAEDSAARDAILTELNEPLAGTRGGLSLLRSIQLSGHGLVLADSASPTPATGGTEFLSPRLYPLLAERLGRCEPGEANEFLLALASFRTRDCAKLLLEHTAEPATAATPHAFAALRKLTGQELPDNRAAWSEWLESMDKVSEARWQAEIARGFAAAADRIEQKRASTVQLLLDTTRRLHLATPADQRSPLLANMLSSDIPQLRDLGFELVGRELSAGGVLGPGVGKASITLLGDKDPAVRSRAAGLVRKLAPDGAGDAVAAALARETDAVAAADLLLAAARWPGRESVSQAIHWLGTETSAADAAAEACWWLWRAGSMGTADASRVLAVLAQRPVESLNAPGIALLASLGTDSDRRLLAPLLISGKPGVRTSLAEVLVWFPEYRESLLVAAAKDSSLFDAASRAQLLHAPTARGFDELLALPRPTTESVDPAFIRLARALPASELWTVAQTTTQMQLRRVLLTSLTSEDRVLSERANPDSYAAIAAGVEAFSSDLLVAGDADGAVTIIERSPFDGNDAPSSIVALHTTALLALGRVELAEKLDGGITPWLRGLDISRKKTHAQRVLDAVESRFGASLSPEERETVDDVRSELAAASAEARAPR